MQCVLPSILASWLMFGATTALAEPAQTQELSTDAAQALISELEFPIGVEVAFEQSQLNPLFRRVNKQQGVMLKSAQDGLVMRVTHPRPEQRTLQDGTVALTRSVRNRHTAGYREVTRRTQLDPDQPSHLVLLALEALLNRQPLTLTTHFTLSAEQQNDHWSIRLEPTAEAMQSQLSRLWFHGKGSQLLRFRSERDDGKGGFSHFLEVTMGAAPSAAADAG